MIVYLVKTILSLKIMVEEKTEQKEVIFIRASNNPGVHNVSYKDSNIRITDRELYPTTDPDLIAVLEKDEELTTYLPTVSTEAKTPQAYSSMKEDELLVLCKERNLIGEGFTIADTKRDDLIGRLQTDDKENSEEKNDQGEQKSDDDNNVDKGFGSADPVGGDVH